MTNKELKIKLVIDGKEGLTTIQLTDTEAQKLMGTLQSFKGNPLLKEFHRDLLNISEVSDEASEGIVEFIQYNQISEKQLQEVIEQLQQEQKVLGINTSEYNRNRVALQNLNNAYQRLRTTQVATNQQFTGMNMLVGQTGFLISDLDMMFVNFRMGMMSIGNNISMVANTAAVAMNQLKGSGQTFFQALKSSMGGMNGVVLGVNLVMFAIMSLSRVMGNSTTEAKKHADAIKRIRDEYKNLSMVEMGMERESLEWRLKYYEDLLEKAKGTKVKKTKFVHGEMVEMELTEGFNQDAYDEATKGISEIQGKLAVLDQEAAAVKENIKNIFAGTFDLSSITNVKKAIELLNKEFENVGSEAERQRFRNRIAELEALQKTMREGYSGKGIQTDLGASPELKGVESLPGENKNITLATTDAYEKSLLLQKEKAQYLTDEVEKKQTLLEIERKLAIINAQKAGWSDEDIDQINEFYSSTHDSVNQTGLLGEVWRSTGNIMANSISRSLGLLRQTDNMLQQILSSILNIGIQMATTGLFMGIASLVGGGGFWSGFEKAFGIGSSIQTAGAGYDSGVSRSLRPSSQSMNINLSLSVAGTLSGKGKDLEGIINTVKLTKSQHR